jgi:hypothetical protein
MPSPLLKAAVQIRRSYRGFMDIAWWFERNRTPWHDHDGRGCALMMPYRLRRRPTLEEEHRHPRLT